MNVLVTGATGFIGSHIVRQLLDQNDNVRGLIRPASKKPELEKISWFYGDLTDPASLQLATQGIDVVYHAAASLHTSDDNLMRTVNVVGVKHLLDACIQNRVSRLIFLSSVAVYASSQTTVIREDSPLGAINTYGQTKIEAETLIRSYADSSELTFSIIRPCVVYGQRDYHFTYRLLRLLSKPIVPIIQGCPDHMILVHAVDVARAAVLAGSQPNAVNQTYNITGDYQTSLQELVKIYEYLSEQKKLLVPVPVFIFKWLLLTRWLVKNLKQRNIHRMKERYKDREYQRHIFFQPRYIDINRARTELGYEPKIDLKEGLSGILAWRKIIDSGTDFPN